MYAVVVAMVNKMVDAISSDVQETRYTGDTDLNIEQNTYKKK